MKQIKVLFVCMADSSHVQSWLELFSNTNINAKIFANVTFEGGRYNPIKWNKEAYVLNKPYVDRGVKVNYLLPNWKYFKPVTKRLEHYLSLNQEYLTRVIKKWKPDIVHALSLLPSSDFAWQSLQKIDVRQRPLFVCSSYGSDIYVSQDKPNERRRLEEILLNCDGFISDCKRDINNALSIGLAEKKSAFNHGIPVDGGINVDENTISTNEKRNVVLVPKAYEGFANKSLSVIEALNMTTALLKDFEVHLLMSEFEVEWHLSKMPQELRNICRCHKQFLKEDVLKLMQRSRVVIAPSVSDGTPISLLEAMWCGALPIMSPLESIKEWIVDKENGLLVNALNPNEIAKAVRDGVTDDKLFNQAQDINRSVIKKRANREIIRSEVVKYYQTLVSSRIND